jgi:peptidyl-prolyl cis-trans isomerase C
MTFPVASDDVLHPRAEPRDARLIGILALSMIGILLSGPVGAAAPPDAGPSSSVLMSPGPSSSVLTAPASPSSALPAPEAPSAEQKGSLVANPGDRLAIMADRLDTDPNFVVLQLESLTITQADVADVVRTMPPSMGSLEYQDVYRRALDLVTRQKALVLRARRDHLDKDPAVLHRGEIAFERVLGDAWLKRQADAAVTDQALHARYDRDVAGKPGQDEVRARLLLVPSVAEAEALIQQVRTGADFAALARDHSKDPTAADGGDLGYVTHEAVSPEIGSAMFSLAPGQVTAYPVGSPMGYFVIRVEGRRSRATPTFDEARPKLVEALRNDAVKAAIGSLLSNIKFVPTAHSGSPAAPSKP